MDSLFLEFFTSTHKHTNNGECAACLDIFNKYPEFYNPLLQWFVSFQNKHPECHISCAGRGKVDQENLFIRGATRAKWMQSSHNWNCAIDIWVHIEDEPNIYPRLWFDAILAPELPPTITWYGRPGSKFKELPHLEWSNWKELRDSYVLKLVE